MQLTALRKKAEGSAPPERKPGRRGDRAVLQHLRFPGLRLDQAEADDGKPRVNAEYPHGAPLDSGLCYSI